MTTLARHLLAALTLLGVLLGTLGRAHPACAMAAADRSTERGATAAPAVGPDGGNDGSGAHSSHGACDEGGDRRTGRGTGHRGIPPAGCGAVAHCIAVAPAPGAVPTAPPAPVAARPREVSATLPRGPALEPEFPPPRA